MMPMEKTAMKFQLMISSAGTPAKLTIISAGMAR